MNKRHRTNALIEAGADKKNTPQVGPVAVWKKNKVDLWKEIAESYKEARDSAETPEQKAAVATLAIKMGDLAIKYEKASIAALTDRGGKIVVLPVNPRE